MRKLYIIPIVHSRQDLGSLDEPIHAFKRGLLTEDALRFSRNVVERFWHEIKLGIEGWGIEFQNLLLYQDALPFTGNPNRIIEHQIVRDLAAKGSPNHQLLEWLVQQGAALVGTESTQLLLQEYDAVRKSAADGFRALDDDADIEPYHSSLLSQRDQFIAKRISETLLEDQVGVLFIGMLHRVEEFLEENISLHYPFGRPKTTPKTLRSAD